MQLRPKIIHIQYSKQTSIHILGITFQTISISEVLILAYDQDGTLRLSDADSMTTVYVMAPAEFSVKLTIKMKSDSAECREECLEVGAWDNNVEIKNATARS